MGKTLREHLEKELRASSIKKEFSGGNEPYSGADEDVRNFLKENFELKYGLIAPVPETVDRVIRDYYQNQGYSQMDMPTDIFRGAEGVFLDSLFNAHNYLFVKGDKAVSVRLTFLLSGEGFFAGVFSMPGPFHYSVLEADVENRQN